MRVRGRATRGGDVHFCIEDGFSREEKEGAVVVVALSGEAGAGAVVFLVGVRKERSWGGDGWETGDEGEGETRDEGRGAREKAR